MNNQCHVLVYAWVSVPVQSVLDHHWFAARACSPVLCLERISLFTYCIPRCVQGIAASSERAFCCSVQTSFFFFSMFPGLDPCLSFFISDYIHHPYVILSSCVLSTNKESWICLNKARVEFTRGLWVHVTDRAGINTTIFSVIWDTVCSEFLRWCTCMHVWKRIRDSVGAEKKKKKTQKCLQAVHISC